MTDAFEARYPLRSRGAAMVGGPVTCATCGCRLTLGTESATWYHFSPLGGRDARGCRIECAELGHDAQGRALWLASA